MRLCCNILICLSLFYVKGTAQIINKNSKEGNILSRDTALFKHYMQEATHLSDVTPDSMHYYLKKAFHLANSIQYDRGLAQYYHFLAADFNERNHYDSAMQVISKEIFWANQSKDIAA